jgi:hypothetical protein
VVKEVAASTGSKRLSRNLRGPALGLLAALAVHTYPTDAAEPAAQVPPFAEVAAAAGIDFLHFNGMSGAFYFPEIVGSGVALFDYDNDGDLDLYLVQGKMIGPDKTLADATFPPPAGTRLRDRLYRNDTKAGPDGVPRLRFTDVTEASGIRATGYGMGVAAGDYDNDGRVDLYVTNYGDNQLWHNRGDGRFEEVTAAAGVNDPRWSVSASFLDYDRDGLLDLFVGNYVDASLRKPEPCYGATGAQDYCSPLSYRPVPNALFRSLGNGRFEDVSGGSGIAKAFGGALGVASADFDGDGWLDIYVANDGRPNQLWMNRRNGTFEDEAFMAGTAVNMDGAAEASMGVDAADFDGDGDEDLFMTHILEETNTIYVNDGSGWFQDRSVATGVAVPSQGYTAFGTVWIDYDNDGWLDLFVANGDVRSIPAQVRAGDPYPMRQPNQLLANLGNGGFEDISARAPAALSLPEVSRGAAVGDLDNDGDADLVVSNSNGPARLLRNDVGNRRAWLGCRVVDRNGRDALGARVVLYRTGAPPLWRRSRADGSYASANDPRVLFGLGDDPRLERIEVHWPDGKVEAWRDLKPGRYLVLRQGEGQEVKP